MISVLVTILVIFLIISLISSIPTYRAGGSVDLMGIVQLVLVVALVIYLVRALL